MNMNGISGLFFKPPTDTPSEVANIAAIERRVDLLLDALQIGSHATERDGSLPPSVARLVAQGLKIQAIKEYRELTGVDLAAAKNAVEGGGVASTAWQRVKHKLDLVLNELGISAAATQKEPNTAQKVLSQDSGVVTALKRGNKTDAILRLYREVDNIGLREAKEIVEQMEREQKAER